jgi:hypothetical protein
VTDQDERPPTERWEHTNWCKERALVYVDKGDLTNALASFASDINKHPRTADDPTIKMILVRLGVRCVRNNDAAAMRKLIEGFD